MSANWKARALRFGLKHTPRGIIKRLINTRLEGIGRMLDLHLDLDGRRLELRLDLAGEERSVTVRVEAFRFDDQGRLVIERATVDREWMNALVQRLLVDRPLPVPAEQIQLLREVLG